MSKKIRMLKAEERTYIPYKVCASYGSSIFLKGNSEVFADDPSEEGFPFRQKCLSRNRENGRVERGGKERYGEEENISGIYSGSTS